MSAGCHKLGFNIHHCIEKPYANAKMIIVETISRMGSGEDKGEQWRGWIQV
jgi:hypothetical protein